VVNVAKKFENYTKEKTICDTFLVLPFCGQKVYQIHQLMCAQCFLLKSCVLVDLDF
jgi:hypothetical protein